MKNIISYENLIARLFVLTVYITAISCTDDSEDTDVNNGNWVRTTPFRGTPRAGAVGVTIGSKAYVGLGYDGDEYVYDFFEFDIDQGYWITKSPFPGTLRERAVAFSIGKKAYVGLGYNRDLDVEELSDFWEYNTETDQWIRLEDFKGTARYNAVSFAIGNKGYVGTGYDGKNYNNDFWEFDPETNKWKEIVSYPGNKREEGLAFVLDAKAYVCTGRNNGSFDTGFWEYDPSTGKWTSRTPDSDEDYYDEFTVAVSRYDATAFTLNGKAYIVAGFTGAVSNATYEYDPSTQEWAAKTSFEGSARSAAVSFVLNNRAFAGMGQSGSRRFDDMWEFFPDDEYEVND